MKHGQLYINGNGQLMIYLIDMYSYIIDDFYYLHLMQDDI